MEQRDFIDAIHKKRSVDLRHCKKVLVASPIRGMCTAHVLIILLYYFFEDGEFIYVKMYILFIFALEFYITIFGRPLDL